MTKRIKVDTRAITKALMACENEVAKAAPGMLAEIAEEAKDFAVDEFAAAEYDGENDVVVDVRQYKNGLYVVARGKALYFIEYGTGTSRDYWYFAGKGRDIDLNSTGREYKYRYVEKREKTEGRVEYRVVEEKVLNDWFRSGHTDDLFLGYGQHKAVKRDEKGNYIMHPRYGRVALSKQEIEGDYTGKKVTEKVKRDDPVYNTEGNPANDVMTRTREYMNEIYPEIIRRHIKRLSK